MVVHAGGFTQAIADGKPLWKTSTGGAGPLLRIGDRVFGVSLGIEENDPLALFALSAADGKHVWRAPLELTMPDGDMLLEYGDGLLIAGYSEQIVAVKIAE